MTSTALFIQVLVTSSVIQMGLSEQFVPLECSACMFLIREMEHVISTVDPRKKVQVGSYRIDPKGNQKVNEVPYGRSEVHLHETVDTICEKTSRYGLSTHPYTGFKTFVRKENFKDEKLKYPDLDNASVWRSKLKNACESFLEDHEDSLLQFLMETPKGVDESLNSFCHQQLPVCKIEDLVPYPEQLESEDPGIEEADDTVEEPTTTEAHNEKDEI